MYVDGLENHLLDTADIDARTLTGVMVPLLLYAGDLILMSESAVGPQRQLYALANFCEELQLQSTSARQRWWCLSLDAVMCQTLYCIVHVERVESYKNLGVILHAT